MLKFATTDFQSALNGIGHLALILYGTVYYGTWWQRHYGIRIDLIVAPMLREGDQLDG
ncbi:hypothetical protein GCM10011352_25610 [Marinobacterium zhoushanense]|uniref:Uncharacterized protein n=1 Tax=Marinobacterium zhoushanense TaxID=1679163 RepID=A0ABQ1KLH6_9GAMM|nr:hypothetical protein GCM10011352_25610 [Marinobacterium zhoushanense]